MLLSIALAVAIQSAADIKTAADLLTVCRQKDTSVCDAYIEQAMRQAATGCVFSRDDVAHTRDRVVHFFETQSASDEWREGYMGVSANEIVATQIENCGADDANVPQ